MEITVFERDSNLGNDSVPKVSVIKDCLVRAEKKFGMKFNTVADLDITSPLRTAEDV